MAIDTRDDIEKAFTCINKAIIFRSLGCFSQKLIACKELSQNHCSSDYYLDFSQYLLAVIILQVTNHGKLKPARRKNSGTKMTAARKHQVLNAFIAAVWLVNGLFCKVLNLVPRHQQIVANILGDHNARLFTVLIGLSEIGMAAWIISGIWPRLNATVQILVIATMNTLEFILVPHLLLWGKINAFFAFLFILIICYNSFFLHKKLAFQP